ncbi:MAG TPA: hypothetical protein VMB72_01330, partial [Acidimicrobiales bacterium]|nr:hypothetical protein [Acidimicrobiales bacterium]
VGGERARAVPVLRSWERRVATYAREAGDGLVFLPERHSITHRQVPNFVARTPKGDAPQLNMVRLRITWIVGHMSAGTPMKALEAASGVEASQLVKYSRHLAVPDPDEVRRLLRDPGGP